jgi:hypothetical protein
MRGQAGAGEGYILLIPILIILLIIWLAVLAGFAFTIIGDIVLILLILLLFLKRDLLSKIQGWGRTASVFILIFAFGLLSIGNVSLLPAVFPSVSIPIISSLGQGACLLYVPYDFLSQGPFTWSSENRCGKLEYACKTNYAVSTGDTAVCRKMRYCAGSCTTEVLERYNGTTECNQTVAKDGYYGVCTGTNAAKSLNSSICVSSYPYSKYGGSKTSYNQEIDEKRKGCIVFLIAETNFSDCQALRPYELDEYCRLLLNAKKNCHAAAGELLNQDAYAGSTVCSEFCKTLANSSRTAEDWSKWKRNRRTYTNDWWNEDTDSICLAILNNNFTSRQTAIIEEITYRSCDHFQEEYLTYCFNHKLAKSRTAEGETADCSIFTGDALKACNDARKIRAYCKEPYKLNSTLSVEDRDQLYFNVCELRETDPKQIENMTNTLLEILENRSRT